jgi:hypothetical protein
MRHLFSPRLETLEVRELLSRARIAIAHHRPRVAVSTPIALDGTLSVKNRASSMTMNADGSSSTTTPVSGQLGALGKVRGIWTESTDNLGSPSGNDTIRLHNSKGALVIVLSNQTSGRAISAGHGIVSYNRAQQVVGLPGAYAHVSEKGMVELTSNKANTGIATMVVTTQD